MIFNVQAEPYQTDVLFCIDASDAQIKSYMRRTFKVDETFIDGLSEALDFSRNNQGRAIELNTGSIIIKLSEPVLGAATMGILVHEVVHAVYYILRRAGIPQTEDTDEAYTYLIQSLCTKAFRKIGEKHWN